MLLIIIFLLITIAGSIIAYYDDHHWHTEFALICGAVGGASSGIAFIIATIMLIVTCATAPLTQANYEEQYNKLLQKVEHIDSYNRDEIIQQVDDWNKEYRINLYAPKSPWIGWYYQIDTKNVDFITLN